MSSGLGPPAPSSGGPAGRQSAGVDRATAGSPLRDRRFRVFYLGAVSTALAFTMQSTVAGWLMATLTPSALLVALVQSASTLPFLLFGLIAGSLADLVERHRVIVMTQLALAGFCVALAVLTLSGHATPWLLLGLTFLVGTAFSFFLPAQQASVNDLVLRSQLPQAVALNAVAFNVSRAVGPALAGFIAAWSGSAAAFVVSALLFAPMLVSVRALPRVPRALPGIPESLMSGVRSGLHYARHSAALRAIFFRNASFGFCASSLLALLPLIARDVFQMGPEGYGLLFGVFGAGAVTVALMLASLIRRFSLNSVVWASGLLWAAAAVLIGLAEHVALAIVGCVVAGGSWVAANAGLSAGAQSSVPPWVRARAVSANNLVLMTSIAAGGLAWGATASVVGLQRTLWAAAAGMVLLNLAGWRVRVKLGEEHDVTPTGQMVDMVLAVEPAPNDGPVLVQRDYRIAPERHAQFLAAIRAVEPTRLRNGASSWRVFRDLAEADRFVERYIIASWAEYVRSRTRMTMADRILQDRVASFQTEGTPIRTSRLIGVDPADEYVQARGYTPTGQTTPDSDAR